MAFCVDCARETNFLWDFTLLVGKRCSVSHAFLDPETRAHENLTIKPNHTVRNYNTLCGELSSPCADLHILYGFCDAQVTKVVFEGKRAVGVEIDHQGQRSVLRCSREIVLSGGAINSPQLLMLVTAAFFESSQ